MSKKRILLAHGFEVSYFVHIIHIKKIDIDRGCRYDVWDFFPNCLCSTECSEDFAFRPKIR